MAYFEHDGLQLGYEDDGSGPPSPQPSKAPRYRDSRIFRSPSSALRSFSAPTRPSAFWPADEERFLRTNPHASVIVFEGASHQLHDEQPDRFMEELLALAAGVKT